MEPGTYEQSNKKNISFADASLLLSVLERRLSLYTRAPFLQLHAQWMKKSFQRYKSMQISIVCSASHLKSRWLWLFYLSRPCFWTPDRSWEPPNPLIAGPKAHIYLSNRSWETPNPFNFSIKWNILLQCSYAAHCSKICYIPLKRSE